MSGRVVDVSPSSAVIELGEGIRASHRIAVAASASNSAAEAKPEGKADLSSLPDMLQARWKGKCFCRIG